MAGGYLNEKINLHVAFYLNKVIKMTKNVRKPEAWNTKETGKFSQFLLSGVLRKLDNSLCTSLVIRLTCILMIDTLDIR